MCHAIPCFRLTTEFARLARPQAAGESPVSGFHHTAATSWLQKFAAMPGFAWVLRMEIQTLMLAWQSLFPLNHLSLSTLDSDASAGDKSQVFMLVQHTLYPLDHLLVSSYSLKHIFFPCLPFTLLFHVRNGIPSLLYAKQAHCCGATPSGSSFSVSYLSFTLYIYQILLSKKMVVVAWMVLHL